MKILVAQYRSTDWYINTPGFEVFYEKLPEDKRKELDEIILKGNPKIVKDFLIKQLQTAEKSTQELRKIAKRLNIPKWSRLSKLQLILEIENDNKKSSNVGTNGRNGNKSNGRDKQLQQIN